MEFSPFNPVVKLCQQAMELEAKGKKDLKIVYSSNGQESGLPYWE